MTDDDWEGLFYLERKRRREAEDQADHYQKLLIEVLEQIDSEPGAEWALGSMEDYRKAVGLPYGCAYHRHMGVVPCKCPPEPPPGERCTGTIKYFNIDGPDAKPFPCPHELDANGVCPRAERHI